MNKKLYVGNLSYSITESQLQDLFTEVGSVVSANIITDRDTGRSKGFGFVEMETDEDATKAIDKFNNYELDGRSLTVNEARPRQERPGGGGRRGGPGGGRGGPRGPRDGGGGNRRRSY